MQNACDSTALLKMQRALRDRLLGRGGSVSQSNMRELAAHMLLYLDDPIACLQIGAYGVLEAIAADRVDAGFGSPQASIYSPAVKALRTGVASKTREVIVDTRDDAVTAVWASQHPVVFDDIARDERIGLKLRAQLLAIGARRRVAIALRDGDTLIGLLCADRILHEGAWSEPECAQLETIACQVIAPIIAASRRLCSSASDDTVPAPIDLCLLRLSPAELKVAQLVVGGYSYKEIAQRLDRAFSTVDHQLRSIRNKLGVNSTAKLIRVLGAALRPTGREIFGSAHHDELRAAQLG